MFVEPKTRKEGYPGKATRAKIIGITSIGETFYNLAAMSLYTPAGKSRATIRYKGLHKIEMSSKYDKNNTPIPCVSFPGEGRVPTQFW